MQNRKKHLDIYLLILGLFVFTSVLLRSIAALTQLNYTYGHYENSTLISVADWLVAGGSVIMLSYLALSPKDARYHASFTTEKTYIPSALVAASLIFLSFSILSGTPLDVKSLGDITAILPIATAILALVSVYYFFLNSYIKDCKSERRARASFAAVLFLCIYPAYLYFNAALPINSPNKVIDQLAYLFCALFFLYEARISLGRDRWGIYAAFGMVAALFTAYSAIPSLAVYFAKGELISNSSAESCLTLSLFIFILSRLLLMRTLPNDAPTELVCKISEKSANRRLEVGDSDIILPESGEQLEFDMSELGEATNDTQAEQPEENSEDCEPESEEDTGPLTENYETVEELVEITENENDDDSDVKNAGEETEE